MQSKMASENSVFYEKLAEEVRSYTCLYDKSSDDFKATNKTRPLSVYTFLFATMSSSLSAEQQIAAGEFHLCPSFWKLGSSHTPRLHSWAHWACVRQLPCAYRTSVNIRYVYVYACAYASVCCSVIQALILIKLFKTPHFHPHPPFDLQRIKEAQSWYVGQVQNCFAYGAIHRS